MSSQILLYGGCGSGSLCVQSLEAQLRDLCDDRVHRVSVVESFSLESDPKSIKALVIPGGHAGAMFFSGGLKETASRVKETIDRYKISYYGSCAGGILASSSFHDRITPGMVQNAFVSRSHKFLDLFPGKVVAPLFSNPMQEKRELSLEDFRIQNIEIVRSLGRQPLECGHILSPAYLNVEGIEGAEILAKYTDLPPFRFCSFKGNAGYEQERSIDPTEMAESVFYQRASGSLVLLSGAHPEIGSEQVLSMAFKEAFKASNEEQRQLADSMQATDVDRKLFIKENFEKIGISCK